MFLLDTCALLWMATKGENLSEPALKALGPADSGMAVSSISAFEISLLGRKGKLELPRAPFEWFAETIRLYGVEDIPVSSEIASSSAELPFIHQDPCDRIIIATALKYRLSIVTADRIMPRYPGIKIIW